MEGRPERAPLLGASSDEEAPARRAAGPRGRAASKARGAAALMDQWPDHLISAVYNYWMMLLFMTILLLVTYGLIVTLSVIPNNRFRHGRGLKHPKDPKHSDHTLENMKSKIQQVYCPIIINSNQRLNMTAYAQRIKSFKKEFPQFEYNIIILDNDTEINSAINNNEVAMKSVLNKNEIVKEREYFTTIEKDFNTEKHLLSNYFDNSPLKKIWRSFSSMMIPFLVRTVAVWEGGGVVFDLQVLLEHSDHAKRLNEEIIYVLEESTNNHNTSDIRASSENVKKTLNNIRDVINDLENNEFTSIPQNNLTSEESEISQTNIYLRSLLSLPALNESTRHKPNKSVSLGMAEKGKDTVICLIHNDTKINSTIESNKHSTNKSGQSDYEYLNRIKTDLLPYFLKVLFNTKSSPKGDIKIDNLNFTHEMNDDNVDSLIEKTHNTKIISQKRESIPPDNFNVDIITMAKDYIEEHDNHVSIGMPKEHSMKRVEDKINIFLDTEGYLIATKTSCHALLGHIFATVRKYPNLISPKKCIDHAMQLFCRGKVDSYCDGVRILS